MSIEQIIAENTKLTLEAEAKKAAPESEKSAPKTEEVSTKETPSETEKPKASAKEKPKAEDVDDDEDDDVPTDEKGIIKLPKAAFDKRIQRATKAHLKALFGTDDKDEILQMKSNYEALKTKQEEERRAKLDELQRLREDKEAAEKKAEELQKKEDERQERAEAEAEERRITKIAEQYIDPDAMDLVHFKFAKHLNRKSKAELAEYTEEKIQAWYKRYAEKHPKFAKAAPSPPPEPPVTEKVSKPLKVGASGPKPSPGKLDMGEKTASPGKANSMTDAEWRDYKKKHGISY